ncbi:sensor histidine kinase [Amphibacillus cookii]|uniref:sensor histidine kinase n=1 Tax=Amphibacillus cookii TaxID=767787 RepID=UPI0019571DC1|nr:sensor histidine kinase [Amphibacillus cookii]MBM7540152.1 two-component system sensor histidine kinase ComP [Amphibacillus cookii]
MKEDIQKKLNQNKIIAFVAIILLLQIYIMVNNFHPYIGMTVSQVTEETYQVSDLHRLGWAKASHIDIGDRVIYVDHQPVGQYPTVQTHGEVEGAEFIIVEREGEYSRYKVDYNADIYAQYLFYLMLPLLYFLFSSFVSLIIYRRNPTEPSACLLIAMTLIVSLAYSSSSLALKLNPLAEMIRVIVFLLSPTLFFHFIYHFFREKDKQWFTSRPIYFSYLFAFTGIISSFISNHRSLDNMMVLLCFIIIMVTLFFQLIRGLVHLRDDAIIDTLHGIFLSIGAATAPFLFLFIVPLMILGQPIIPSELANVFLFFIPAGFLYMLVSDQLYIFKFKINQLPYYMVLAFLFSMVITLIYLLMHYQETQSRHVIPFFALTFLLTLLFLFIKRQLDHYLRSYLFVSRDNYQASLYRFSEAMKHEKSRQQIIYAVKREVEEVLAVIQTDIVTEIGRTYPDPNQSSVPAIYTPLLRSYHGQTFDIGKVIGKQNLYAVPLAWYEGHFTILFIALKNDTLSKEQYDWLSSLAQFANLAIENQLKVEDLLKEIENAQTIGDKEWLSRLLFHWSENERRSLASDIHDTFLQDLIILRRRLEAVQLETDELTKQNTLQAIEEEVKDIIFEIRETCTFLYPTILSEIGLIDAINELINKFRLQSNSALTFHTNIKTDLVQPLDLKMAIYRIVQEWLNNARKHAQAKSVWIVLVDQGDRVKLEYKDDGIGIAANEYHTVDTNMGLLSIKERVRSLSGDINLETARNKGVRMTIFIPYHEGGNIYETYSNRG